MCNLSNLSRLDFSYVCYVSEKSVRNVVCFWIHSCTRDLSGHMYMLFTDLNC